MRSRHVLPGLPPPCCAGTSARFRSVTTNRLPSPGTLDASTIPPCDERAYAITEDGAEGGAVFSVSTPREDGGLFVGRAGTFALTDRTGGRLKGRFALDAVSLLDSSVTVSLEGTFSAIRGAVNVY